MEIEYMFARDHSDGRKFPGEFEKLTSVNTFIRRVVESELFFGTRLKSYTERSEAQPYREVIFETNVMGCIDMTILRIHDDAPVSNAIWDYLGLFQEMIRRDLASNIFKNKYAAADWLHQTFAGPAAITRAFLYKNDIQMTDRQASNRSTLLGALALHLEGYTPASVAQALEE